MKNSNSIPVPDDLAGWKEADNRLHQRMGKIFAKEILPLPQTAQQYFNDTDVEYFFERHHQRSVIPAFASWGILQFRPAQDQPTQAEQLLAGSLPEAQKLLLRTRMESPPSLHRVVQHMPDAGTIELEDVLLGGKAIV